MKTNNPFDTYSRGMTARERRIRSKWALALGFTILITTWLIVKVGNQQADIEELEKKNSELHDEFFIISTVNGRYELSLEYLKEVNPKAAKDFEDFFDHQTE